MKRRQPVPKKKKDPDRWFFRLMILFLAALTGIGHCSGTIRHRPSVVAGERMILWRPFEQSRLAEYV